MTVLPQPCREGRDVMRGCHSGQHRAVPVLSARAVQGQPPKRRFGVQYENNVYITGAQLAQRYGLHPRTPANWRLEGKGPRYRKIGAKAIRYRLTDVLAWERHGDRFKVLSGTEDNAVEAGRA